MVLRLKVKQMFLKCFYDNTIDSLNIVVILAPGHEFFSTKCAQFPLTFLEEN